MVISFVFALLNAFVLKLNSSDSILYGVLITTIGWLIVTFLTKPEPMSTLTKFYQQIKPAAFGWKPVINSNNFNKADIEVGQLPLEIACTILGTITVYSTLFFFGFVLYSHWTNAIFALVVSLTGATLLAKQWNRLRADIG